MTGLSVHRYCRWKWQCTHCALFNVADNVRKSIRRISDAEKFVNITHRVCSETPKETEHEICVCTYQSKPQETTSYKVTIEQQCHTQEEVQQDTCYNVPMVMPMEEPVPMSHPHPMRNCLQKTVSTIHFIKVKHIVRSKDPENEGTT